MLLTFSDDNQTFEYEAFHDRNLSEGQTAWLGDTYKYRDVPSDVSGAVLFAGPRFIHPKFKAENCVDITWDNTTRCVAGGRLILSGIMNEVVVYIWGEVNGTVNTPDFGRRDITSCSSSSQYLPSFSCARVFDGDLSKDWATNNEGSGSWIILQFGKPVKINLMKYANRDGPERNKDVELKFSGGSSEFIQLRDYSVFNEFSFPEKTSSFVRIEVHSVYSIYNNGAKEIEFWYVEAPGAWNDGGLGELLSLGWEPAGEMWIGDNQRTADFEFQILKKTFRPAASITMVFPMKEWVGGVAVKQVPTTISCIAQPCKAPVVEHGHVPSCLEGDLVPSGAFCNTVCSFGYVPTIAVLNCTATVLSPKTFACVGAPCNSPTGIKYGAWPSCRVAAADWGHRTKYELRVQVDHHGVCFPQCQTGYGPVEASLDCNYGVLSPPYFKCVEQRCFAPGSTDEEDSCSMTRVGGIAKINAGTTWFITLAALAANRALVCYEDVSEINGRASYCGVVYSTGTSLNAPVSVVDVSTGRATDLVLAQLSDEKAVLCYRAHAHRSHGLCKVLHAPVVAVSSGEDLVIHESLTWRLAVAQLSKDKAVVCYQHEVCSCRVLVVSGLTLSRGAPLVLASVAVVHLALGHLSMDRVAVCIADSSQGDQGLCRVLAAESDDSLTQGPDHNFGDGAAAHLALAPIAENKALVCFSDWSDSEYGKCMTLNSTDYLMQWGEPFTITHQVGGNSSNEAPGTTRFIAMAHLQGMNESAVACFQTAVSVQERYGYCKVIRSNGTAGLYASTDLVLNPGTSWNFAMAPLSSGKVAVCYADTAESEHGHCHALMPGVGEETWNG